MIAKCKNTMIKSIVVNNLEDAAVFHRMAKFGVCVLDPTRTMSLIPAILQG